MKITHIKKITLLLSILTLTYNLSGCSPLLVVGAAAGASATIATDRRSTGKMLEDQAIELQATDFIYSNKTFGKKVRVSVTSVNNIVLLTGEVPKAEYRDTIYEKIVRMRAVRDVINKIQVRSKLSAEDRSNDLWITSKIKTRILAKKGLLSRTKVITSDEKVYLMGMVTTQEAEEIIAIIKEMGINNIIPLYEPYNDNLSKALTAQSQSSSNPTVSKKALEKTLEEKLREEDNITIKPYVITPPITLNNDE